MTEPNIPEANIDTTVQPVSYARLTPAGMESITRRDATLIALRIIALYTAYNALLSLMQVSVGLASRGNTPLSVYLPDVFMLIFYGGIGLGLWFGAARITLLILRGLHPVATDVPEPQTSSALAVESVAVGIALIGIWMLAFNGIPFLFLNGAAALIQAREMGTDSISTTAGLQILNGLVRCAVGLFLFIRARRLATSWSQFRAVAPSGDSGPL
jgi:hypothetical protein